MEARSARRAEAPDSSASTSTESAPSESPAPDLVDRAGAARSEALRPPPARPRHRRRRRPRCAALLAYAARGSSPAPCGSTSSARRTSSAASSRRRPSSTSWSPAPWPSSSAVNLALAFRRTEFLRTRAGVLTVCRRLARHREPVRIRRRRSTGRRSCSGGTGSRSASSIRFTARTSASSSSRCRSSSWCRGCCSGWSRSRPCYVVLVYRARGALGLRPLRATFGAQVHLASLAAIFLLVVAWRFRLEQYMLELGQPSARRQPLLRGRRIRGRPRPATRDSRPEVLAVVLAVVCVAAPFVARAGIRAARRFFVGVPARCSSPRRPRRRSWSRLSSSGTSSTRIRSSANSPTWNGRSRPQDRSRARHGRRRAVLADRQLRRRRLPGCQRAARPSPDLGHVAARGADAPARHRDAVLQAGGADARRRAGRRATDS